MVIMCNKCSVFAGSLCSVLPNITVDCDALQSFIHRAALHPWRTSLLRLKPNDTPMNDLTPLITYAELSELEESEFSNEHNRHIARLVMAACTDWPVLDLEEPLELLDELHKEIVGALTYESLNNYEGRLLVTKDAWKKEALASLLEIFRVPDTRDFIRDVPLEIILKGLKCSQF